MNWPRGPPGGGDCPRPHSTPGTRPGLPPGSAGPCPLVPGPWAPGQANTQRRHAVLFSLRSTGRGGRQRLWLTGSTQGGHIRHQESPAKVCNPEARGKLCFAQHHATWIFIPALCKRPGHSSRGQHKGMAAQVPFPCQGGSRLTPHQRPRPSCSGGSCPLSSGHNGSSVQR